MNKKKIAQNQIQTRVAEERKDPRNSLLICAVVVFAISFISAFFLTSLYQTLGTLAENYSVDIEKNGTFLHILCELGAPIAFYLNSFLGTFVFFIGAAYICRFAYLKKSAKSASAALVLCISMYATNIIAIGIFILRRLSGEYIRLADPAALVFDLLFLILRVFVIWAAAKRLAEKKAKPRAYAMFSAVFMLACALLLEFSDTTLPYLLEGKAQAVDYLTMLFAYGLYLIHSAVGYITVKKFLEGRKKEA